MVLSTESSEEKYKYLYKFKLEEYEGTRNYYSLFSHNRRNFGANYQAYYKAKLPMTGIFVNSQ